MLPFKNRIKKKKDFEKVFQEGDSFLGHFFILKTKKNSLSHPRFAFVVSNKKERKAVRRNKIRRLFREAVRNYIPLLREDKDVIFIIKREARGKEYEEIKEEVEKAFKRLKLI